MKYIFGCQCIVLHVPIKAPKANREPIHALSSLSLGNGSLNGESNDVWVVFANFGFTGEVHPSVVPTAKLDKFTEKNKNLMLPIFFYKNMWNKL